jgi:nucleoside-diphosphate-sugar epimerase
MSFLKSTGKAMADVIPGLGRLTFDNDLGKIFVTSGTGVIGYRVAMSLLEQGQKDVRVRTSINIRTSCSNLDRFLSTHSLILYTVFRDSNVRLGFTKENVKHRHLQAPVKLTSSTTFGTS